MIVVADTTPLNYLILIERIEVLRDLFGGLTLPGAVLQEMLNPRAPQPVRAWASNLPVWVEVRDAALETTFDAKLGDGERQAIALAQLLQADLLLIDELRGRNEAERLGLRVTGTIGVLKQAHLQGGIDLREAFARLRATSFQTTDTLLQGVLAFVGLTQ